MVNMTYQQVEDAIRLRLKTFTGLSFDKFLSSNRPVDGAGAFTPPENSQWVRWTINYGQSFIAGVADKPCTRRVGIVTFQIFTPKGQGTAIANDLAEKLTQHFNYHVNSHLEVLEASRTPDFAEDKWYQTNVNLTFRVN